MTSLGGVIPEVLERRVICVGDFSMLRNVNEQK